MPETSKHAFWFGLVAKAVSYLVALVIGAAIVGGKRERVASKIITLEAEVTTLKDTVKKQGDRLHTMDLQGSTNFHTFQNNYNTEQAKQYELIKELQEKTSHNEAFKQRLEWLERRMNHDPQRKS